jgi:hypothetical protein
MRTRLVSANPIEFASEKFQNCPRLFHTKAESMIYTIRDKLLASRKIIYTLHAENTPSTAATKPSEDFKGM